MTELDCSVKGCVYNKSNSCCKGEIQVEGMEARNADDTCCGSFSERTSDSYSNEAEHPIKSTEVGCDATSCIYNENLYCSADNIDIAGANASHCAQTECATYECR